MKCIEGPDAVDVAATKSGARTGLMVETHAVRAVFAFAIGTEAMALAVLTWSLHRRERSLRDLGLGAPVGATDYALSLVIAAIYSMAALWAIPSIRDWSFRPLDLKLVALIAAAVAAVFEGTYFRAILMEWLRRLGCSPLLQVLSSGIALGLAHVAWGLFGPVDVAGFVQPVLWTSALGWGLAALYLRSKRSLALPLLGRHGRQESVEFKCFSNFSHCPRLRSQDVRLISFSILHAQKQPDVLSRNDIQHGNGR
jgi:hypothetical protein